MKIGNREYPICDICNYEFMLDHFGEPNIGEVHEIAIECSTQYDLVVRKRFMEVCLSCKTDFDNIQNKAFEEFLTNAKNNELKAFDDCGRVQIFNKHDMFTQPQGTAANIYVLEPNKIYNIVGNGVHGDSTNPKPALPIATPVWFKGKYTNSQGIEYARCEVMTNNLSEDIKRGDIYDLDPWVVTHLNNSYDVMRINTKKIIET